VSKLKFTLTKKNQEKMAIVTLEDLEGSIDLLVFPKAYKTCGAHLVKDAILFFKGNLDKKEQDPKLLVNEVTPIAEVHKKFMRSICLKVASGAQDETLKRLQEILQKHPGNIPVYLEFKEGDKPRSQLLVDRSLYVKPDEILVQSLQEVLGSEGVSLRI
jgi:DNA polymerase-3 subunit alpha